MKEHRLTRPYIRIFIFSAGALLALSLPLFQASAQTQVPPAPASQTAVPAAPGPAPAAPVFPKPVPTNFTASEPTPEVVNSFLDATWGYDENRVWQVQAILKTPVEGISKVVVFVGDKTGKDKPQALVFFALADGKHMIVTDQTGIQMIPFGAHPFADARAILQEHADGPYRGSANKNLELVEFADFQCPHCKEAQANMDKLVADFPSARIVFQNSPIASIHPQAVRAASYGICVAKLGGSTDFFQFASAVFDGQDGLGTADGATLTLNSAVIKTGLDADKVSACAATPETKAEVDASVKLGTDLGVAVVPTLMVNGRDIPANIPYEELKKIILFQIKLDGITAQ
jgi:protein-disulfide isomerase